MPLPLIDNTNNSNTAQSVSTTLSSNQTEKLPNAKSQSSISSSPRIIPLKNQQHYRYFARLPYRDRQGDKQGYFYLFKKINLDEVYKNHVQRSGLFNRG